MPDETNETPPSRSRMALIIPVVTLLLGAGAGAGGAYFAGKSSTAEAPAEGEAAAEEEAPAAEGEAAAEGEGAPAEGSAIVAAVTASGSAVSNIGAFTINLRGSGGGRVLRLEVQVETAASKVAPLQAMNAQIRDSIITAVSDYTWSELEGTDGKTRLRDELITRVNGVSAPIAIDRLYFTQFVVQ